MATSAKGRPIRIVIFIQENKTTDFYFPTLADWGAEVVHLGNLLPNAPDFDQPHDRNAWVHYKMGDYPAARLQVDTERVIPFYSWLAKQLHRATATQGRPEVRTEGARPHLAARGRGGAVRRMDRHRLHPHVGRLGRIRGPRLDPGRRDGTGYAPPEGLPGDRRLPHSPDHVRWPGEARHRAAVALSREPSEDRHRPLRTWPIRRSTSGPRALACRARRHDAPASQAACVRQPDRPAATPEARPQAGPPPTVGRAT